MTTNAIENRSYSNEFLDELKDYSAYRLELLAEEVSLNISTPTRFQNTQLEHPLLDIEARLAKIAPEHNTFLMAKILLVNTIKIALIEKKEEPRYYTPGQEPFKHYSTEKISSYYFNRYFGFNGKGMPMAYYLMHEEKVKYFDSDLSETLAKRVKK